MKTFKKWFLRWLKSWVVSTILEVILFGLLLLVGVEWKTSAGVAKGVSLLVGVVQFIW